LYDGTLKFDTSIDKSGFQLGISSLGNIAKQGMSVISAATAAAVGAVGMLGKQAVETGISFDKGMSQIGATLGYSVDEINTFGTEAYENMEALTAKAEEMGAKTAFSASQAADGLNILAMSGYSAEESIQMIDSVLDMAAAGSIGLADAAAYVSGAMKGFTKEAENFADSTEAATYYADMIAKGATLANTNVRQLGEAMSQSAAIADSYGQSAAETEVALLRLAEQNETGAAAATMLSAVMKNLYTPLDQAAAIFDELGFSAYDAMHQAKDFNTVVDELNAAINQKFGSDAQGKADYIEQIFGIQGAEGFKKLITSSGETVQKFYDGVASSAGSAALQAKTALDNLAGDITIFNSAFEGFQIAVSKNFDAPLREAVQQATEYMSELTEITKAEGLDGLAASLGGKVADALNFVSGYVPKAAEIGVKIISGLAKGLAKNLPAAAKTFSAVIPILTNAASDIGKSLMTEFLASMPDLSETGLNLMLTLISGIADGIPQIISSGETLLSDFISNMEKKAPRFQRLGREILQTVTKSVAENLPALTETVLKIIDFAVSLLTDSENLSGFVNAAVSILLALTDGLIQSIPILIEKAPEIVAHLEKALEENADLIKDTAAVLLDKLGESLKEAKDSIKDKAPEIMQNVIDALKNAPFAVGSVADSVITAIADALGIGDKWETVKEKVKSAFDEFDLETVKLNLELAFEDIPDDVKQNFENVSATFSEASDRLKESFDKLKESLSGLKEQFQPILDTLKEYFTSGEAGEDASDALGTAITVVSGAVAVAADAVSKLISGIMDFGAWLAEGSSGADAFAASVIGIVTTIGAFAGIMKIMETAPLVIAGVKAAVAGLTGSATGLWAVIAANPLVALIAVLAGLSAALVHVMKNSEEWQIGWQMLKDTFQDFKDAWKTGWKEIKEKWEDFWDSWKVGEDTLEEFGEKIFDFVEGAKQWGKDLISNFISGVKESWNDWENTWEGVGEVIYDLLHHTHPDKGLLKDDYTWMPDMMQSFAEGIEKNIPQVENQAENLTDRLKSAFENAVVIETDLIEPEIFELPEIETTQKMEFIPEISEIPAISETAIQIQTPELVFDTPEPPEIENPELVFDVPELPEIENPELVLDAPELPEIENPELVLDAPELPEMESPELVLDAPELPEIENPELVLDTPELPEMESPELVLDAPELPEIENPELVLDAPELPEMESPELVLDTPELPEMESAELVLDTPELPEIENPEFVLDTPEAPELEIPDFPDFPDWLHWPDFPDLPDFPEYPDEKTHPGGSVQNLPEMQVSVPELSFPEMPAIDVPELEVNLPDIPDLRLPEIPPEALNLFRMQSLRMPDFFTKSNPVSETIHNHYAYSTVNNHTENHENISHNQPSGDIIIPVSIGGQQIETLVLSAIQIENARSGGRTV